MHFHHLGRGDDDETKDELIRKYKDSNLIHSVQESISKRLGLKDKLKLHEIKGLYQLCAFDLQLYNGRQKIKVILLSKIDHNR